MYLPRASGGGFKAAPLLWCAIFISSNVHVCVCVRVLCLILMVAIMHLANAMTQDIVPGCPKEIKKVAELVINYAVFIAICLMSGVKHLMVHCENGMCCAT